MRWLIRIAIRWKGSSVDDDDAFDSTRRVDFSFSTRFSPEKKRFRSTPTSNVLTIEMTRALDVTRSKSLKRNIDTDCCNGNRFAKRQRLSNASTKWRLSARLVLLVGIVNAREATHPKNTPFSNKDETAGRICNIALREDVRAHFRCHLTDCIRIGRPKTRSNIRKPLRPIRVLSKFLSHFGWLRTGHKWQAKWHSHMWTTAQSNHMWTSVETNTLNYNIEWPKFIYHRNLWCAFVYCVNRAKCPANCWNDGNDG